MTTNNTEKIHYQEPIDIYFLKRQVTGETDSTKYYFKTIEQLMQGVESIGMSTNSPFHIQWSLNPYQKDVCLLMREYWSTDRVTKLKCKEATVAGYIIKEKGPVEDLVQYLKMPIYVKDIRNKFVSIHEMEEDEVNALTIEEQKAGGKVFAYEPTWD